MALIERVGSSLCKFHLRYGTRQGTANLRTRILDFGGFDSSIILILRGGILMSIGDFPESLRQAILGDSK